MPTYNQKFSQFHREQTGKELLVDSNYLHQIQHTPLNFIQNNIQLCLQDVSCVKFTRYFGQEDGKVMCYDFEVHPLLNHSNQLAGVGIGIFDVTDKYAAHLKLQQSEELFKALVLNSADVFQLTDSQCKIQYVSGAITKILGFEVNDVLGKYFLDLVHPEDKPLMATWMRWLLSSPSVVNSIELRVKTTTGQWTHIELTGNNMIGISNVDAVVMTYRDIQAKKAADNALAHAEQRMSMLLNNTKESFIIVNKRLKIVTYNKAAQECSPHFFVNELQSGVSFLELIDAREVENIINTFEQAFEGQEAELQTSFVNAEGQEFIYSHTYRPLFSGQEIIGVFITSSDITERKLAEQRLRASEERYRTIIQESFDATVIKDANNIIIDVSPAIEKILGYQPNDVLGRSCFDFLHEDYYERVQNGLEYVLTEFENEISMDTRMLDKWKRFVWVEMKVKNMLNNKHIKGIIVLLRDITERKRSEEIISLSEQRFRGLVQSGADMISIIDEEGYIRYSSPTVFKVLGTNPSDDIGRNVFELIHPEDKAEIITGFEEMLHNGARQQHFGPYRYPDVHGEFRWLEAVVTNLSDDPAIRGIVINYRDVTTTKRLNEEQKALTDELIKNNQDLQQFSFITSHNLRAPVANLISLLSLYDKENPAEPFNKILIEKFEESTRQLNNTLNDLLNVLVLKSQTHTSAEVLSFDDIFHHTLNNLQSLIAAEGALIHPDFSKVDTVQCNKIHLESIFQNLISNAIKYKSPHTQPIIWVSSSLEQKWIVLTFRDNGMGIDLQRYKDRLFGLYQRFHAGKEGKGLGLYMIKAQVTAMGGKIEVESELGKGTTFKVYLKYDV